MVTVGTATVEVKAVMVVPHKVVAEAVVVEAAAADEEVVAVAEDPALTKHSLSYSYVTVYDSCSMTHHFEQHYCPFLIRLHLNMCIITPHSEYRCVTQIKTEIKMSRSLLGSDFEEDKNLFDSLQVRFEKQNFASYIRSTVYPI